MSDEIPRRGGDAWIREGHREPHPDAVVKVTHHSKQRGSVTRWLEPGQFFEVRNDDPTYTTIEVLSDDESDD